MKMRTMRLVALTLILCLVCIPAMEVSAVSNTSETFEIATVTCNNQTIEVPVKYNVQPSKTQKGVMTSTQTVYFPLPTDESLNQNRINIREIKKFGHPLSPLSSNDYSFTDREGYICFFSTINYYTTRYNNSLTLYHMTNFKLEREVYSEAYYRDFNLADARVVQIGTEGGPASPGIQDQAKNYDQINYNQVYSIPSDWKGVAPISDWAQVGVTYTIKICYSDGTDQTLIQGHHIANN